MPLLGPLSKTDTEVYKGIGILLIVLHNFFHNLDPIIGENEFSFSLGITERLITTMSSTPLETGRALFSYFGHYGVQVFVFLSAYGLTRKYSGLSFKTLPFLRDRFDKVYVTFLVTVVFYLCHEYLLSVLGVAALNLQWDSLLWKLLLLSNFIPGQALEPVGPWWFIPFIFQFYLVFPLILAAFNRWGVKALIVLALVSIVCELLFNNRVDLLDLSLNHVLIGHLPVLCLGIYLAARGQVRIGTGYLLAIAVLFLLGNFEQHLWVAADVCITLIFLVCGEYFLKSGHGRSRVRSVLSFYGAISIHLFLVNGFIRSAFYGLAETHNTWWIDLTTGFGFLLYATIVALLLKYFDRRFRKLVSSGVKRYLIRTH